MSAWKPNSSCPPGTPAREDPLQSWVFECVAFQRPRGLPGGLEGSEDVPLTAKKVPCPQFEAGMPLCVLSSCSPRPLSVSGFEDSGRLAGTGHGLLTPSHEIQRRRLPCGGLHASQACGADRWALCVEVVAEISRPGSLPHVGACWRKSVTCLGAMGRPCAGTWADRRPAKAPIPCTVPARGTCQNSSDRRV